MSRDHRILISVWKVDNHQFNMHARLWRKPCMCTEVVRIESCLVIYASHYPNAKSVNE